MSLAVVRDLREGRSPATPEELADFETDVLAGFVLARAAAGLADGTIRSDVGHLDQLRAWFGRPLWEMEPADADAYFGSVLRGTAKGTRLARAQALKTYFLFVELRHKVEIHNLTGRVVECPIDELNRPRGQADAALRIPPSNDQVDQLFAGWRAELATCRKFAPTARNFAAARLMAEVGLRVNEVRGLDLADVKWDLGRFGSPSSTSSRRWSTRPARQARKSTLSSTGSAATSPQPSSSRLTASRTWPSPTRSSTLAAAGPGSTSATSPTPWPSR